MKMIQSKSVKQQVEKLGLAFLAEIPYDPKVEDAIGDADKLLDTMFAKKVEEVVLKIATVNSKKLPCGAVAGI